MKRRLNILCLLVGLILAYSVVESVYMMSIGFRGGMEMSKQGPRQALKTMGIKDIYLLPEPTALFKDSVYNEVTGTYVPAMFQHIGVIVPTKTSIWSVFLVALLSSLGIVAMTISLMIFIQLIISINKSVIFTWKNVHRIRLLGTSLLITYLLTLIPTLITWIELSGVFSISGYTIYQLGLSSFLTLVLGVVTFIIGEVFAIGLRLKEEQELTI